MAAKDSDESSDDGVKDDSKKKHGWFAFGFGKNSNVPKFCQLWSLRNIAIPATYFVSGLTQGLQIPILTNYAKDIGLSLSAQKVVQGSSILPLAFRILLGSISDNVKFGGYRRRPALFSGWFIASASMTILLAFSNTTVQPGEIAPSDAPSIGLLGTCTFFFGLGVNLATVVADAMAAEKYQLETKQKGSFLGSCIVVRYVGSAVAMSFSTFLYSAAGSKIIFLFMTFFPALVLHLIMYLEEDTKVANVPAFREITKRVWAVLQTRAAWQSMGSIFLFQCLQLENSTVWAFFQYSLKFTETQLNVVTVASLLGVLGGVTAFKFGLFTWSWTSIYFLTTVLAFFGSLFQLSQVLGFTFSIDNFAFAILSEWYLAFIDGIQIFPVNLIIACLCPSGGEATTFALLSSVTDMAWLVNSSIVRILESYYNITKITLGNPEVANDSMKKLTITIGAVSLLSALSVSLMPSNHEELMKWKGSSLRGGGYLLVAIAASAAVFSTIYSIVIMVVA